MTSFEQWIDLAAERSERAAASLRRLHSGRKFLRDELQEAENELHAACECCKEAAILWRVTRDYETSMRREDELALSAPDAEEQP
jgi:hypothetical protein